MMKTSGAARETWKKMIVAVAVVGMAVGGLNGCGSELVSEGEKTTGSDGRFGVDDEVLEDHLGADLVVVDERGAEEAFSADNVARFESPKGFRQVGLMLSADSVDEMEVRGRSEGEWTEWRPVEPYFTAGRLHNAHVVFDRPVQILEWRVGEAFEGARIELFDRVTARTEVVTRSEFESETSAYDFEQLRQAVAPDDLVTSREQWGAIEPDKICNDVVEPFRMTIHHTYDPSDDGDDPAHRMQQMQSYHINTNGWCDIGYHFVVAQSGEIFQGRSRSDRPGAHVGGENDGNVGISMIGDYTSSQAPSIQIDGVVDMVEWVHREHGVELDSGAIKGHRQWPGQSTSCPGDAGLEYLDDIIDRADQRIDDDTNGEEPDDNGSDNDDNGDDGGENDGGSGGDDPGYEEETGDEREDSSPLAGDQTNVEVNDGCGGGCATGSTEGTTPSTDWLLVLVVLGVIGGRNLVRRRYWAAYCSSSGARFSNLV